MENKKEDKFKFVTLDENGEIEDVPLPIRIEEQEPTVPEREEVVPPQNEDYSAVRFTFSAADEIEKFKGLLDKGIITQEEFDAKKKQLLGL